MSDRRPDAPIRVTLVLPRQTVPVWLRNILISLQNANFVSLSVIAVTIEQDRIQSRKSPYDLWMWLEKTVFRNKIAAAEHSENLVDISAAYESEPPDRFSIAKADELNQVILRSSAELIVWMLPGRPSAETIAVATHGVLTIAGAFDRAFGFREFTNGEPATRCDVIVYGTTPSEDSVLATSFAATDPLLIARGIVGVRAKSAALLMATIKRTWCQADPRLDGLPNDTMEPYRRVPPGFLRTVWGLLRIYARHSMAVLMRPLHFEQWQLAFRIGGDRLDQEGLQRLAPAHKGFWADPFVAERDGRKFIIFEELSTETSRGHLVAIEIRANGEVGEPVDIMRSEHHLSYPFLFEFGDSLFMVPECGDSGRVEVFRCEQFPDRWVPHAVLLDGVRAFDPTLIEHDGLWWMFVTIQHDGNSASDELHLFYANGPFDEWTPHPLNPVRLDVRAARPAGALFRRNGKLFRPAQDCSGRYGWAISIQEVLRMTTEEYAEVEVRRISADWAADGLGTHTVNQANGVTVYDFEAKRRT